MKNRPSKINGNRGFFTKEIIKNFIKVEFLKKKFNSTKVRLMEQPTSRSYKLHTYIIDFVIFVKLNT